MKHILTLLTLSALAWQAPAQVVDRTKYPDYDSIRHIDTQLAAQQARFVPMASLTRPVRVNNAETMHFPTVFNQDGGSCGSASRICYMFTHELNSFRNLNGREPENYYPSHFVWLLTNSPSGKDEFITKVGVPSAAIYGGRTYSSLFGYQVETDNNFGWMTGYDKWYAAMFNRMWAPTHLPISVETEEGRELLKNWLWNHAGDADFHSGGVVGIGVASAGRWESIPSTPTNDAIGVTKKKYVAKWGTQVDHALTIVGYDDRIEFDLNGNGIYGEKSADEVGAWIVVNSWGPYWCNNGFVYCPYAHAGAWFNADGTMGNTSWWQPEIYRVRKNYRPLRTIKLRMDYSRRSELLLSVGVSADLNATEPDMLVPMEHFRYAGDGRNGNTVPAPEVPMLGKWADGKLHDEPMEFGYDLTDLSASFDQNMPLKYFFIIQTKPTALGSGHIYNASIIDYRDDLLGIETPFNLPAASGTEIKSAGQRTIISTVVQGAGFYAPQNPHIEQTTLSWTAPIPSALPVTGYNVYCGTQLLGTVAADVRSYDLGETGTEVYGVSALYGTHESNKAETSTYTATYLNQHLQLNHCGFTVPGALGSVYEQATIEYWMNPNTLEYWNQSGGPGWGTFQFHANGDGSLTAGWDVENRCSTPANCLTNGTWRHVAYVVDGHTFSIYIDGVKRASVTSDTYSGLGGFGDLVFKSSGNGAFNAKVDELRIWRTARTASQILTDRSEEIGDGAMPDDLLAYYKSDLFTSNGVTYLRDHSRYARHAPLANADFALASTVLPNVRPSSDLNATIQVPQGTLYAGTPLTFALQGAAGVKSVCWECPDAGVSSTWAPRPSFVFSNAGTHTVKATAYNANSESRTLTAEVTVTDLPAPSAAFTLSQTEVKAGERVTFLASQPRLGYLYRWQMPGADTPEAASANAAATYDRAGDYSVTLTVSTPAGAKATQTQRIHVSAVAPQSDFEVSQAIVMRGDPVTLTDRTRYAPTSWNWFIKSQEHVYNTQEQHVAFMADEPGVYDISLTTTNEVGSHTFTQGRALIVCNAESHNGLNFSYDEAGVTLAKVPFTTSQQAFTIDWWMRAADFDTDCNPMGDTQNTLLFTTTASGAMQVQCKGSKALSPDGFIIPQQWHHYAVVFAEGNMLFYRDGRYIGKEALGTTTLPSIPRFVLGGNKDMPFRAQIDEFRIWNQALTLSQLQSVSNAPLTNVAQAEANMGLQLYYTCNQSGGDVQDATSKQNHGTRSGFGPDGDAWGLSRGVFCLNFTQSQAENVTAEYLVNYTEPFVTTGQPVNMTADAYRFWELKSWKQENAIGTDPRTGAHVDKQKNENLTITTEWDYFAKLLADHKVYQTLSLPAGTYEFRADYGEYEGESGNSYLVAAPGSTLPGTLDLADGALAYKLMQPKSAEVTSNAITFTLTQPATVSVGLLVNMEGKQCLTLSNFSLTRYTLGTLRPVPEAVEHISLTPGAGSPAIYDLSGRPVTRPVRGQIYIMQGRKVMLR